MTEDKKTESEPHIVTMNRMRERLGVLMAHGAIVGEGNRSFINATLNAILKDIENDRIKYESAATKMEKQVAAERAKAEACRAFRSLVFNVVDKFALAAEKDAERNAELDALEAEAKADGAEKDAEDASDGEEEDEYELVEVDEEEEEGGEEQPEEEPPPPPPKKPRRRKKT